MDLASILSPHKRRTDDLVRALAVSTVFGERTVLEGIDLAIRRGEVFVIMGPSGCGKTTLLRNLCGLLPPTMGSVSVAGHDVYSASPELLQHLRLRTGLSAPSLRRRLSICTGSTSMTSSSPASL